MTTHAPVPGFPGLTRSWFGFIAHLGILVLLMASLANVALGQEAPKLASVTPEDGATLVPPTTTLVFVFDQEMDTTVPLFQSIGAAIAGNFEVTAPNFNQSLIATWGADKKSFTVKAAIQFPYATFTWRLNPTGSLFPLKSKAGVALATVTGTFSTGVGGTPPVLVSSNPAHDSIGVSPSVVITFNFDQVMKTNTAIAGSPPGVPAAVAWTGTGLDVTKFRYTWAATSRSLFCDYVGDLPVNTEITWELNPSAAPVKLENPAGKVMASGTYAGRFTTGSGIPCNPTTQPPTQGSYTVFKATNYQQPAAGEPDPMIGGGAYVYGAIVQGPSLGPAPTAGSLTKPGGTVGNLVGFGGPAIQYGDSLATEEEFEAAVPSGDYTLRFTLGTLPESSVVMTVPSANPPIPRLTNFDAAQAIRADADFTLTWNAFEGAGKDDYISISIYDDRGRLRFQAPDPCVPRELPSTATSVVIPARSFPTNAVLSGAIVFQHNFYLSTNQVANMAGFGTITRSTQFSVQTLGGGGGGGTPVAGRFSEPRLLPNGNPQFVVTGSPGSRHSIQRSASPVAGAVWTTVQTLTLDASGRGTFEDASAGKVFPSFYRALAE